MQAAAKLGVSITISQVGNDMPSTGTPATLSAIDKTQDWQPALTLNEDGLLHQLHSTLVQAIEASKCTLLHIVQLNVILRFPSFGYVCL